MEELFWNDFLFRVLYIVSFAHDRGDMVLVLFLDQQNDLFRTMSTARTEMPLGLWCMEVVGMAGKPHSVISVLIVAPRHKKSQNHDPNDPVRTLFRDNGFVFGNTGLLVYIARPFPNRFEGYDFENYV
jgi:hypothetical protein